MPLEKIPKLPPSFLAFQKKCNEAAKTNEDKLFIIKYIQEVKESSMAEKKFYITNWLSQPIPTLPSAQVSTPNTNTNASGGGNFIASQSNSNSTNQKPQKDQKGSSNQKNSQSQPNHLAQKNLSMNINSQAPPVDMSNLSKNQRNKLRKQLSQQQNQQSIQHQNQQNQQFNQVQNQIINQHPQSKQQKHDRKQSGTQHNQQLQSNLQFYNNLPSKQTEQVLNQQPQAGKSLLAQTLENASKKRKRENDVARQPKKQATGNTKSILPSIEGLKAKALVGTCQRLEKDYTRLTSEPDPSTIRPQAVLEQTLKLLKHKYINENASYIYMCSQLKSMRQDLVIQCIRNDFTVRVYESHARISLQNNDLNQFNQCQGQLKSLYAQGVPGNMAEFTCYRLMYYAFVKNFASLTADLRELGENLRSDPLIRYALRVINALNGSDYYVLLGELLRSAPKMAGELILLFAPQLREDYLFVLAKSHAPTQLTQEFIRKMLGLQVQEDAQAFFSKYKLSLEDETYSSKDIMAKIRDYRESQT